MILDPKKARTLDCSGCTVALQALRNCDGRGSPAKVELNDRLYRRCPRAIFLENPGARYLVNTFMDCRRMGIFPHPGGPGVQTQFTVELFDYLEGIIAEYQQKQAAKAHAAQKNDKR